MELKEIEQILDPIPMTGAIQRQIMQAIQAYGKAQYNQALELAEQETDNEFTPHSVTMAIRKLKKH